ncbi:MAG TPA: ATP-binding protein [Sphingobium sp.]
MKGRLFWKIFSAFLLTFVMMITAMWAVFTYFLPIRPAFERWQAEQSAPEMVAMAAIAIRAGGIEAFSDSTAGLRPKNLRVVLKPRGARRTGIDKSRADSGYPVDVVTPQGQHVEVAYRMPPAIYYHSGLVPIQVYAVGLIAGLLFASALAFYLARPIRRLRAGFETFAHGDLSVRLGPKVGRRRDEIADLAHDFDGMADRVEALVKAREQLIDDVSHELRSPLARLQLAIALTHQKPERAAFAFDRIEREAARLDQMVGELLTLSRLESGAEPAEGYFDMPELIRDVVSDASFESARKAVFVEAKFIGISHDMGSQSFAGDAELVRRALENILRNAIRYAPSGSLVAVSLAENHTGITITIEDEGPGIAQEEISGLFEPFRRGADGGFGLGLSIARRTILAHQGSINVSNRKTGGLSVAINLPVTRLRNFE